MNKKSEAQRISHDSYQRMITATILLNGNLAIHDDVIIYRMGCGCNVFIPIVYNHRCNTL